MSAALSWDASSRTLSSHGSCVRAVISAWPASVTSAQNVVPCPSTAAFAAFFQVDVTASDAEEVLPPPQPAAKASARAAVTAKNGSLRERVTRAASVIAGPDAVNGGFPRPGRWTPVLRELAVMHRPGSCARESIGL